jgi:hypothetical protein
MAKKKVEAKTSASVLGKISIKTTYGVIAKKSIPDEGLELELVRFAGMAKAVERGEGNFGAWASLKGDFAAQNKQTGEMFISQAIFVPSAYGDALIASLENALMEDAGASIDFCVDVSIKAASNAIGYEYVVRPIMDTDITNKAVALLSFEG